MIEYLREFNSITVIVRLILACICGSLLGLNREKQGRAAGLRTYYIVCLGSCCVMLLGQYLNLMLETQWAYLVKDFGFKTDVTRFASKAVNGIGFLGAGSILLTRKNQVRGLTSAASLWTSCALGLAIGAGFIELGVVGFIMIMFVLKLLHFIDKSAEKRIKRIAFGITLDDLTHIPNIITFVKNEDIDVLDYSYSDDDTSYLELQLQLPRYYTVPDFIANMYNFDFVKAVKRV